MKYRGVQKITKKIKECKICGAPAKLYRHHLVPKNVIRSRKGRKTWHDKIIYICLDCHNAIHEAYLTHVHMSMTKMGYCKFNSVRYSLLKKYLKSHHPLIWKEWANEFKEFVNDSMEAFSKENLENEWD